MEHNYTSIINRFPSMKDIVDPATTLWTEALEISLDFSKKLLCWTTENHAKTLKTIGDDIKWQNDWEKKPGKKINKYY